MNDNWGQGDILLLAYEWRFLIEEISNDFSFRTWESFIETMKFELSLKEWIEICLILVERLKSNDLIYILALLCFK